MSNLMKRSLVALAACGLCAGMVIAQGGLPSTPPMPSQDQVKDAAKDAMKEAQKKAEELKKQAEEAAKKAMGDHTGGDHGGQGMPDQAQMEAMMKAMQPGPMHEWMSKHAGEWDMTVKSYHSPGGEPEVSKMTCSSSMAMNGRFLIEKVSGEINMGGATMPFNGVSTLGYDNFQKKFVSTWYDDMSTGMMFEMGTVDATGKVLTMEGENWNMHTQSMAKSKSVTTIVDDKTRTMEMWAPGPDGKMAKQMEITYTRK